MIHKSITIILLFLTACDSKPSYATHATNPLDIVRKVIDGAIVEIEMPLWDGPNSKNRTNIKSRLAGIDVVEPFGPQATTFSKKWIDSNGEWIEFINKKDCLIGANEYGSRQIWIMSCSEILNVELVRAGLARINFYGHKNLKYTKELKAAEAEAKQDNKGIWSK